MPHDRTSRPMPSLGPVPAPADLTGGRSANGPPPLSGAVGRPRPNVDPGHAGGFDRGRAAVPASDLRLGRGEDRRRSREPRRRGGGLGRAVLWGLGGLVGLALGGMALLVVAPPIDLVRDRFVAAVEHKTGRKLSIGGGWISLASGLGVSLTDVSLSAPPGMQGAPLLTAERIDVQVALLPFILREIKVRRLALQRPVLDLRRDSEGRRSWDFASDLQGPAGVRFAQALGRAGDGTKLPAVLRDFIDNGSPPADAGAAARRLGLDGLSLADVRIKQGVVRYRDGESGVQHTVARIDARLAMPSYGAPMEGMGRFEFGGQPMAFSGGIDTLRELLDDRAAGVRLKLDGPLLALSYDGKASFRAASGVDGAVDFKARSVLDLMRLLGLPAGALERDSNVIVSGALKATAESVALTSANIGFGRSSATGEIRMEALSRKPKLNANLRFATLDLDHLGTPLSGLDAKATPGRFAAPPVAAAEGPRATPPASIGDLLKDSQDLGATGAPTRGPQVRGFQQRAGNQWETDPIDVAALSRFDLDGRFQVGELVWRGLRARSVVGAADLKGGHLRASVTDAEIDSGRVRGLASVDTRQGAIAFGANVSGDNVAVGALLRAAGVDVLDGRGRVVVALSALGASERELVSTLGGRVDLRVAEGALVGWNGEALLATLGRGTLPSTRRDPEARTPFRQLSGSFDIANGVARSRDLLLESAVVHTTGTGLVNLVDRNIDFVLKPKTAGGGIEVPLRIAGPWDNPNVVADLAAVLKSPKAQEAVQQLKNGNVDGALRSVLGEGPKAEKKIEKAKEFLRQFLKQ